MKVINLPLLQTVRARGYCELCGQVCRPHPHHVFAKGHGGGGRLDIPENLIALDAGCHDSAHAGRIPRQQLLEVVARRERTTVAKILEKIHLLRRTPK